MLQRPELQHWQLLPLQGEWLQELLPVSLHAQQQQPVIANAAAVVAACIGAVGAAERAGDGAV